LVDVQGVWHLIYCEQHAAFALFDKDGNGDISKKEMRDAVQRIYRERKALIAGLKVRGLTSRMVMEIDLLLSRMSAQLLRSSMLYYLLWHLYSLSLYSFSSSTDKILLHLSFRLPLSFLAFRSFLDIPLSFCLNLCVRHYGQ
jgi:hypothetical protein